MTIGLLEGEANIFFEGTFVGISLLDVRLASDTLQLSLGKDKNVIVNRKKKRILKLRGLQCLSLFFGNPVPPQAGLNFIPLPGQFVFIQGFFKVIFSSFSQSDGCCHFLES